jgi:NADPH2:quinone reductase
MRAVVVRRHGGPDVLELIDLPIPESGPGQWITGSRGVDVVLDGVEGPRRRDLLDLLAPLGRLVAYGNASGQPEPDLPSGTLRTTNKAFVGFSITALKVAVPQAVRELTMRAFELVLRVRPETA